MKKTIKTLLVCLLLCSLLLTLGGCSGNRTVAEKYAGLIENFVPDRFNMLQLTVGQVDDPTVAIWAELDFLNIVKISSTDESVIRPDKNGQLIAVGEGSAYVIYAIEAPVLGTVISDIYFYTVNAADWGKYTAGFTPTPNNAITLQIGQQHTPAAAAWLYSVGRAISSDESVVVVNENGTVTAVEQGTAYVVYIGSGDMFETYLYTVGSDDDLYDPEDTEGIWEEEIPTEQEEYYEDSAIDFDALLESAS